MNAYIVLPGNFNVLDINLESYLTILDLLKKKKQFRCTCGAVGVQRHACYMKELIKYIEVYIIKEISLICVVDLTRTTNAKA